MAGQDANPIKPVRIYKSVFIEGGCHPGQRDNRCMACRLPPYQLTKDKIQALFVAIARHYGLNGSPILYRDLSLVKTVVECASRSPAIQCHRGDFDPKQVGEMEVNGEKYPHAGWLVASLTHVDDENMGILLGRIHAQRGMKFKSGIELIETLEKNMLNVSFEGGMGAVTLDYRSEQEKIIIHEGGNTGIKYAAEDLLKPENARIVSELKTLVPREKLLEIFNDPFNTPAD